MSTERRRTVFYGLLSIAAGATLLFVIVDACSNTIQRHHPLVQYWAEPRGFIATLLFLVLVGAAIMVGWPEYSDRYEVQKNIEALMAVVDKLELGSQPMLFPALDNTEVWVSRREHSGDVIIAVCSVSGMKRELRVYPDRVENERVPGEILPLWELNFFRSLVEFICAQVEFKGRLYVRDVANIANLLVSPTARF